MRLTGYGTRIDPLVVGESPPAFGIHTCISTGRGPASQPGGCSVRILLGVQYVRCPVRLKGAVQRIASVNAIAGAHDAEQGIGFYV